MEKFRVYYFVFFRNRNGARITIRSIRMARKPKTMRPSVSLASPEVDHAPKDVELLK